MKLSFSPMSPLVTSLRLSDKTRIERMMEAGTDDVQLRFGKGEKALNKTELRAQAFAQKHGQKLSDLGEAANLAGWNLYTQGGENGRETLAETTQVALLNYKNNKARYREIQQVYSQRRHIHDPILLRQVEVLYRTFHHANMSPTLQKKIIAQNTKVSSLYNSFRAQVDGKALGDQDLKGRFKATNDPQEAQKLWLAKHATGSFRSGAGTSVAEQVAELVRLRNQMAQENGFSDYYSMSLAFEDIDEKQLVSWLKKVRTETDAPYGQLMTSLDKVAQKRFKLSEAQMADVRYPWFHGNSGNGSDMVGSNLETLFKFNADAPFQGKNPVPLVEAAANLMGNSVRWILDKSSLFYEPENKGKSQHWALYPMRRDDIRVLANIDPKFKNNMAFAYSTMLHEALGHGLDYAQTGEDLPATLGEHHTITTEASAMMHEDLMTSKNLYQNVLGFSPKESKAFSEKAKAYYSGQKLAVIRSMMAIIDFERTMYKTLAQKPDTSMEKLNDLWWQKQSEYLQLKRPEGRQHEADWARVPHYADAPVYYQDYFLGDMQRAQQLAYLNKQILPEEPGNSDALLTPEAGAYMKHFRAFGLKQKWMDLVKSMTGRKLSPKALVEELGQVKL